MKVTIELDDFWMEEDGANLTAQLKEHICCKVKTEMWENINKKVKEFCETEVKKQIEKDMYDQIRSLISENLKTNKVKKSYSNTEVTLSEWIAESLSSAQIDRGFVSDFVSKAASAYGNELKQRYDLLFASQIVSKMNENGLLKEKAAELLLQNKS